MDNKPIRVEDLAGIGKMQVFDDCIEFRVFCALDVVVVIVESAGRDLDLDR